MGRNPRRNRGPNRPSRVLRNLRWQGLNRQWFKRELARRDGLACRLCGAEPGRAGLTMDHITPWSKGGRTELENLQLLCEPCNVAKADS